MLKNVNKLLNKISKETISKMKKEKRDKKKIITHRSKIKQLFIVKSFKTYVNHNRRDMI